MSKESVGDILNKGKWFQKLPSKLKQSLQNLGKERSFASGEIIFARGDKHSGLYAVLSGNIRISGLNEHGKEAILTFIEAPNWFGEVALFDEDVRTHDAIAEGDVRVLHVAQSDLLALLDTEPVYWKQFGLLIAHKLRLAFRAIEDLALLPAPVRLARRLILMAEGYGDRSNDALETGITISVPQEQLGAMLSISRQTTNQILKDLAEKGLLKVTYGEIQILNLTALKQFINS